MAFNVGALKEMSIKMSSGLWAIWAGASECHLYCNAQKPMGKLNLTCEPGALKNWN